MNRKATIVKVLRHSLAAWIVFSILLSGVGLSHAQSQIVEHHEIGAAAANQFCDSVARDQEKACGELPQHHTPQGERHLKSDVPGGCCASACSPAMLTLKSHEIGGSAFSTERLALPVDQMALSNLPKGLFRPPRRAA